MFQGILNNFSLQKNPLELLMLLSVIFHAFSYSSSSFIEEEHQTWYYFANTIFIIFFVNSLIKNANREINLLLEPNNGPTLIVMSNENILNLIKWCGFFVVHLFLRRLNQTGDKWLAIPDIGDWLDMSENKLWLSWFLGIGEPPNYYLFYDNY